MMAVLALWTLTGCAQGLVPQARNVDIPAPQKAEVRPDGINETADSVMYLPLGRDVLVPTSQGGDPLPDLQVGPYELRGETLGGALQLLLADVDIPIAFQTDLGLTRTVTVTNLRGKLNEVVDQVCSLADLYCAFERNVLVVKERQSFTITLPPLGAAADRALMMTSVAGAIKALTGRDPVVDNSSRTIVYEATSRTADQVDRYFQRLRASTSLVVYETYVWEVSLNAGNSTGIDWDGFANSAKWKFGVSLAGTVDPDVGSPISIGLPTTGNLSTVTGQDVLKFISSYGAVKTISQPQLTVLSGSTAKLRVADKQNFVSRITRTVSGEQVTVATETDSVESGFTLNIESGWDNATVYGNINISLQEVRDIITFDDNPESIVQLPQTTEREVQTQVRVRPGDSLLIAGLVRENDSMSTEGPGLEKPLIPTSRSARTGNVELVFLLKPRVIIFTDSPAAHAPPKMDRAMGLVRTPDAPPQTAAAPTGAMPAAVTQLFSHEAGDGEAVSAAPAVEIYQVTPEVMPAAAPSATVEPVVSAPLLAPKITAPTPISPLVTAKDDPVAAKVAVDTAQTVVITPAPQANPVVTAPISVPQDKNAAAIADKVLQEKIGPAPAMPEVSHGQ
jgi:hypothetical protein